jgi:hypothetical protein
MYGVYTVAGIVGLVVSTSLLLLVILARMKGGWSISAVVRMVLLRRTRAPAVVPWRSASVMLLSHVIMISLSIRGRDLGISGGGAGFFFLRDTVVNGLLLFSAAAVIRAAQVRSSVFGLCGRGEAGMHVR